MSKLYFFRHAQASFGAANYDKLSDKGIEQAHILGRYLVEKEYHFDKIYSGPLERQRHTCDIVIEEFAKAGKSLPHRVVLQGLREHSATKAMKIMFPELMKNDPVIKQLQEEAKANPSLQKRNGLLSFKYFIEQFAIGNIAPEGVENWASFSVGVREAFDTIISEVGKGETIASFSSGGTISSITAIVLGIEDQKKVANLNFSIRNTAFTTFLYSDKLLNLLSFNELPHLEKEMVTFV